MPFTNQSIISGPYNANGVTNAFPFSFLALSASELKVFVVSPQGVETELSGFEVQGVYRAAGGNVVFPVAPNYPGQLLYVQARPTFSQTSDFENQEAFNPADLNRALDRAAQRDLYLSVRINNVEAYISQNPGGGGGGGGGTGGAVNWSQITGKPDGFKPAAHTHPMGDIIGLAQAFQAYAEIDLSNVANSAFQLAALRAGIGNGSGGSGAPSLADFGEINGDGETTEGNDAAFLAAEASIYPEIYIPPGVYRTTRVPNVLTKSYFGRGTIRNGVFGNQTQVDPAYRPAKFSYARTMPETFPYGDAGWFRGDQRFSDGGEWKVIGYGVRERPDAKYFESTLIPHHAWFDVGSGHSGLSSRLANPVQAGATSAVLWASAERFPVGTKFRFGPEQDNLTGLEHTITVAPNGNTITFEPPLAQNYPAGAVVARGKRTWSGQNYVKVRAYDFGGGDIYGHMVRLQQNYRPDPGQKHYLTTGTVGQYGGIIEFGPGSSGTLGTGWESQYVDNGEDVAVFGQSDTFYRSNDTGARGCVWLGAHMKSAGAKAADAAFVASGKWRTVLDTTGADLSTFAAPGDQLNIAVNMAQGQRIALNSKRQGGSRSSDPNGHHGGPLFGSTPGDMMIDSGKDDIGDYISLWFNRAAPFNGRLRIRPDGIHTNVTFYAAKTIATQENLVVGANNPAGFALMFGSQTGNFIRYNQASQKFEFYKGNQLAAVI